MFLFYVGVSLAAQVLSARVAAAQRMIATNSIERAKAEAIQLWNDWFDVMNSGSPFNTRIYRCGLGIQYHAQFAVLDKMLEFIRVVKLIKEKKEQDEMAETEALRAGLTEPQINENDANEEEEADLEEDLNNLELASVQFMTQPSVIDDRKLKPNDNTKGQPWMIGVQCSILATKALYKDLVEEGNFGISYILTKKLNQDCLENFFSQFRGTGGQNE